MSIGACEPESKTPSKRGIWVSKRICLKGLLGGISDVLTMAHVSQGFYFGLESVMLLFIWGSDMSVHIVVANVKHHG